MGLKEWIIPQDRVFYDLLEKLAGLARDAATQFGILLTKWDELRDQRERMKDIEDAADRVGHELFDRLNRTFITPVDREDIARLAHAIDDVVDAIYAATNRLVLFEIPEPTDTMREFSKLLAQQVDELAAAVGSLRRPRTMASAIPRHHIEIHRLENTADVILNQSVAQLFRTHDALAIIKYKEIYQFLEDATDRCEDVADVLQDIVRKHG